MENWIANTAFDTGAMAEESIRGRDKKISSCIFIETLRREQAMSLAEQFHKQFTDIAIGVYRLICERH